MKSFTASAALALCVFGLVVTLATADQQAARRDDLVPFNEECECSVALCKTLADTVSITPMQAGTYGSTMTTSLENASLRIRACQSALANMYADKSWRKTTVFNAVLYL